MLKKNKDLLSGIFSTEIFSPWDAGFNFNFLKEASGSSSEDSLYMKTNASLVVALSQVWWNPLEQEI